MALARLLFVASKRPHLAVDAAILQAFRVNRLLVKKRVVTNKYEQREVQPFKSIFHPTTYCTGMTCGDGRGKGSGDFGSTVQLFNRLVVPLEIKASKPGDGDKHARGVPAAPPVVGCEPVPQCEHAFRLGHLHYRLRR